VCGGASFSFPPSERSPRLEMRRRFVPSTPVDQIFFSSAGPTKTFNCVPVTVDVGWPLRLAFRYDFLADVPLFITFSH